MVRLLHVALFDTDDCVEVEDSGLYEDYIPGNTFPLQGAVHSACSLLCAYRSCWPGTANHSRISIPVPCGNPVSANFQPL